jgi:hypothetical protein
MADDIILAYEETVKRQQRGATVPAPQFSMANQAAGA